MRILHLPRAAGAPDALLDRLMGLGPTDAVADGAGLRVLLPGGPGLDGEVRAALALPDDAPLTWSEPTWRDAGSVAWIEPRPRRVAGLWIRPAEAGARRADDTIWLHDGEAFGTGAHPTTALCLEALDEVLAGAADPDPAVLDLGTGSGILALAAVRRGAGAVLAIDIDAAALAEAQANVTLNGDEARVTLRLGGPEAAGRRFPVVFANILAAPLQALAAEVADTVGHGGELVLSGVPVLLEREVVRAYLARGMRPGPTTGRDGWSCLRLRAGW